jgi:hypothetical protein
MPDERGRATVLMHRTRERTVRQRRALMHSRASSTAGGLAFGSTDTDFSGSPIGRMHVGFGQWHRVDSGQVGTGGANTIGISRNRPIIDGARSTDEF